MKSSKSKIIKHEGSEFELRNDISGNEYVKITTQSGKVFSFSYNCEGRYALIHFDTTIEDISIVNCIKPEITEINKNFTQIRLVPIES
ncbi:MAG: hypothetical protein PHU45_02725 [Bacilli bacterium]|nr:hypothetical protein [Bacilli bacterium]